MKIIRYICILLCVGLILAAAPVPASGLPAGPEDTDSAKILHPSWGFETNQAADISVYDHRQLMVSGGCDVNGDGFDDVLVGKRDYDHQYALDDNGRVWFFTGGLSGLSNAPVRDLLPPYLDYYGFFGEQVACAGDVNGDGYEDLMVGMDNYESGGGVSDEGAVYVYYGSSTGLHASPDWMARGNALYAHFAISIDSAGDVNGDGYDDIIAGAWRSDNNQVSHAYLWYGGASGLGPTGTPANADWVAADPKPGTANGDGFGRLVRGVGDVNGDGYDDILVGAPNYSGGVSSQGAVFVWLGSASGPTPNGTTANADWMAVGAQADSRFGLSGDGAGDLNADGFDDLAIGAYYYSNPETHEGAVFVWYGSSAGLGVNGSPANADWMAKSNIAALLGFVVRPAGDINGDGFADLLVTAPSSNIVPGGGTLAGAGAWFVWLGGASGLGPNGSPDNAGLAGYGDQENAFLGRDDAGAGDFNRDGLSEIVVAAYRHDNGQTDEGVVFGYASPYHRILVPIINK